MTRKNDSSGLANQTKGLDTFTPPDDPVDLPDEGILLTLGDDELTYKIWGGDWCGDCQAKLPPFAAALEAAGISAEDIDQYSVEKESDGGKIGPFVSEYTIERIPTVVVERGETEIARFIEDADESMARHLANQIQKH